MIFRFVHLLGLRRPRRGRNVARAPRSTGCSSCCCSRFTPPSPRPTATATSSSPPATPGDPLYFPLNAVRGHTPPRDIAALVTEAKPDRFTARVYCFGETERAFEAELLLLKPGKYRVTIDAAAPQSITIAADARRVALKLPSRKEAIVRIGPAP